MNNPVVLPSQNTANIPNPNAATVILDGKAIAALVDQLLTRAGLSQAEVCRRLGVHPTSFNQYRIGRRVKPSLWWIVRLANVCGARIVVEFPPKGVS